MRALDRKLLRDFWHLRGQVAAIGLIIASGVAVLIMALSTLEALYETTDAYYERYRMAEVFARLERAPLHVAQPGRGPAGRQGRFSHASSSTPPWTSRASPSRSLASWCRSRAGASHC